jgi:agmatinase
MTPFLGSDAAVDYDAASVVVLPIPFAATSRCGCDYGPAAILEASRHLERYDEELEQDVWSVGIHTPLPIADTRGDRPIAAEEMLRTVEQTVGKLHQDGKFVIALGGEHSITRGIVSAYHRAQAAEPFTVVQIDARADLCCEYAGSVHNHRCVMRRIIEMGLPTVQLGIRSLQAEEAAFIAEKQLIVFRGREIAIRTDWIERAVSSIPTAQVFLTIDLSGLDPSYLPAVKAPAPGGLQWYALIRFLKQVFQSHQVIGCDVVELAPLANSVVSDCAAAQLIYKMIGYQSLT